MPRSLRLLIDRSLEKDPEQRFRSATELAEGLSRCRADLAAAGAAPRRRLPLRLRKWVLAAAILVGVAAAGLITRTIVQTGRVRWAHEQAIPEIERLVEQDRYLEAFTLAKQADGYLHGDPKLTALWPVDLGGRIVGHHATGRRHAFQRVRRAERRRGSSWVSRRSTTRACRAARCGFSSRKTASIRCISPAP